MFIILAGIIGLVIGLVTGISLNKNIRSSDKMEQAEQQFLANMKQRNTDYFNNTTTEQLKRDKKI